MPHSIDALRAKTGQEIGTSDWKTIDQDIIDRFADVTGDYNFIHVDPVAARATPFGGTIAHGLLTLSMLPVLVQQVDIGVQGSKMSVNYGFDKVRMVTPVKSGERIRARVSLKDMAERAPGQWMITLGIVIDIDGEAKPALVTDWLTLQFV